MSETATRKEESVWMDQIGGKWAIQQSRAYGIAL